MNSFNYLDYFFELKELLLPISIIAIIGLILVFCFWIFGAIGVFKISKSFNIKNSWISFIYPLYAFSLGRVAEKYIKKDGTKSAKLGICLLILGFLRVTLFLTFFILFLSAIGKIGISAQNAIDLGNVMTPAMFKVMIYPIICYFVSLAVNIAYLVLYYLSFWRISYMLSKKSATVVLIIGIFASKLVLPIYLFTIRNKTAEINEEIISSFELVE